MAERKGSSAVAERSSKEQLSQEFQHLLSALAGRVMSSATDRVGGLTDKLSSVADGGGSAGKALEKAGEKTAEGKSPLTAGLAAGAEGIKDKVKSAFGGGKGGGKGGKQLKVTNIIEEIDIGAPVDVVYNQWTQFQDWSNFMKKVEDADEEEDDGDDEEQTLNFKAQVLWSHRSWEATIVEQVPDERIVWRSKGEKGHVDGAVTFHKIGPSLTRVLVVLEYHPQGFFERTGNLWRAQGRRVRLELKHFRRHVMTQSMLHPDELEGWRGEVHDSKVTRSHEEASRDEGSEDGSEDDSDDSDRDADDEYDEDSADEDVEDEDEYEEEEPYDEAEDGYDDEVAGDEYEEEDEEEEQPSPRQRPRRRAAAGSR
jgi:uncharacterized membrane protein